MNIIVPKEISSINYNSEIIEPDASYPPDGYVGTDYQEYDPAKTYSEDNVVWYNIPNTSKNASDSSYIVWYRCNRDDVTGFSPHENPLYWSVLIPENRTAFLDRYMDTQTISHLSAPIDVTLNMSTAGAVNYISLFNIQANNILITVGSGPEFAYDMTDAPRNKKHLIVKIPATTNPIINIIATNGATSESSSGYVAIGKIVCGYAYNVGKTLYNTSVNLMSLSTKERDTSGYTYYKKGNTYKEASYSVLINNTDRSRVYRTFEAIDALDCVFIPDVSGVSDYGYINDMSTVCYGAFSDFSLVLNMTETSEYSISVEGTI